MEVFLNTFLQLSKKIKIDDSQVFDMLYKKLSNEFKDRLIIVRKAEKLNDLILLLRDIDAKMKKNIKQSQLRIKPNTSNFPATKPPSKSYNSASTKPSTAVKVVIVSPACSNATGTHLSPIDVSIVIRRGPILQEEKDRHNSLGLCRYCGEPGHIAIDHRNPTLLDTKKQATGTFTSNSMALIPYKPLHMEEKETSLD